MTTTDIAKPEPRTVNVLPYTHWQVSERAAYARILAGAGDLIPSGLRGGSVDGTAAKVFLVLETGAMLGLDPMAALAGIDVIEGRASISPRVALGLLRSKGNRVKIEETGTVEGGDLAATVTLIRADDPENPIAASFSVRDALRAGLVDSYAPDSTTGEWVIRARAKSSGKVLPWEAYPQDMVVWRAVSRLMRRGAQDVMMGIGYIPEELEAVVTEEGTRVDMSEIEDEIIARIKTLDDRADMAALWREHNRMTEGGGIIVGDAWTKRVQAEFDSHLMTCTKDSRPPREGAPGHTGLAAVDGNREEAAPEAPAPEGDTNDAPDEGEDAPAAPEAADGGEPVEAELVEETDEERERREYADYLAEQARDEAAAAAAATEQPGFDASALR